jgi:membrane associated rhomboid family serine protease
MGYQERDYYREEGPSDPLGIGALSMTSKIIIVTVLVYLIDLFFGVERKELANGGERVIHHVTNFLALHADWWLRPWQIYQLLTSGFAHDPDDPKHILFNMLGFFFFGRLLEERWGGKGLLKYYLISIIFCGLVWSARHFFMLGDRDGSCIGASGGVTAVIILFCLQNPKANIQFMFIPMPAWLAGAIIVGIDLLGIDFTPDPHKPQTAFDAHLAGAAFAVAVWGLKINFARLTWLDAPGKWFKKIGSYFKSRPNLRVHTESANFSGRDEDEDLEIEGDRILAKISTHGDASLTSKERRTLEKYSRLMRERRK